MHWFIKNMKSRNRINTKTTVKKQKSYNMYENNT